MVEVKSLCKKYGDFVALDNLDFSIEDGEVFGFVGPNGAGKTTTMRIMAGLIQPDSGRITIAGTDALKNDRRLKSLIGYMPDFFGVYDNLKVIEYMEFYASIYGITGSKADKLCRKLLELVDLEDKSEFFVDELSRGMKQRLCLARCLVHDPQLLILDEPASGLDPRARLEIQKILKRLKERKKTIIISSHILQELSELCTSVGVIDRGKMLVKGKVDDIMLHLNASNPVQIHVTAGKQTAVNILKNEDKVKNISISDNDITVGFLGTPEDEADLLKKLITNNVKVTSFVRQSGNLEEIFMKVTEKREVLFSENKDKSSLW
ncbi:ABC transporter ATP-binding protein [Eubacterium sp. MSJ-13]|uniref:ABC transporter ATP-binding protein n=1 Tax=Eubacterium sp. MSJ-13 TaxID=2841513 RepID=UPI001C0F44F4|nr:ABC transporter ATP-binding protein [Eubacterium sp. MSJ-13]MBU5479400.1 ABC transporter ATP-binding protein [Eubacterium sp. MSJ-13]